MAAEFKWNPRVKTKIPAAFRTHYPGCDEQIITPANFENFVIA